MNRPVGIDTNILVHGLLIQDERKHKIALSVLRNILLNPSDYVIAIQVFGEFISTVLRVRPKLRDEALDLVGLLSKHVTVVHYTTSEVMKAGKAVDYQRFWDAVLAFTYKRAGVRKILTENVADFKGLIPAENPFEIDLR